MDYDEALAYLDAHLNREVVPGGTGGVVAGEVEGLTLGPVEALLGVLGDPQAAYPVIHVTGTNGKGSVARMISAVLGELGLSVGTYLSPHLERVNERLCRNLEPIADDELGAVLGEVAAAEAVAGVAPSYFELLTAAALAWFAEVAVDVAVVEVGLLGRFDATNVVDADVAVITNVGLDHTDGEGDWRRRVAWEKAGIVTPRSHLVLGEADPELRDVFTEAAGERLWVLGEGFGVAGSTEAVGGRLIDVFTPAGLLEEVLVPLHGRHQATNAAIALAAVEAFFARPTDPDVARAALAGVEVPGRFEVVGHHPLVVLDGAHNPPGAEAAAATLDAEFVVDGRRILVVGLLDGRSPRQMLEALAADRADLVIACRPDSPRAIDPAEVVAAAAELGTAGQVVPDVAEAVTAALVNATEADLVLVTGSLYVVGAARAALRALAADG